MRYVTMDKTWIHHYTPESNWQSAEWTARGENRTKRPKTQISPVRFWAPYFIMHTVFYSSITLRKEEPSILNIIWRYWCIEGRNCERTTPNEEEKSALSPRQCTVSQVDRNDGKIARITP